MQNADSFAEELSKENEATKGKMRRLRLVMEQRRAKRKARRQARAAPYTTQWAALTPADPNHEPNTSTTTSGTPTTTTTNSAEPQSEPELQPCSPEPVVAWTRLRHHNQSIVGTCSIHYIVYRYTVYRMYCLVCRVFFSFFLFFPFIYRTDLFRKSAGYMDTCPTTWSFLSYQLGTQTGQTLQCLKMPGHSTFSCTTVGCPERIRDGPYCRALSLMVPRADRIILLSPRIRRVSLRVR